MQQRRTECVHHQRLRFRQRTAAAAAAAAPRGLSADLLLRGAAIHDPVYICEAAEARRIVAAKDRGQARAQQLPRQILQGAQQR